MDIIIGIIVIILSTWDDDWASLYVLANEIMAIAKPDINNEAARQITTPKKIDCTLKETDISLKTLKFREATKILDTVNISPIIDATMLDITVAKYLPIINSFAVTGNVNKVSKVPFSFSTAVGYEAIFVEANTMAIIM